VKLHKLSDRQVRSAPVGRYSDGGGLYLNVRSKTARSWLFFYVSDNKRTELGLGPYPDIGLSKARELAAELRSARAEGIDPKQARDKKRERSATFAVCAEEMLSDLSPGWTDKYRDQYRRGLTVEAAALADMPVTAISTDDVLRVLEPLWTQQPDAARRLRPQIEKLLDWSKARGLRQGENPARWRGHLANLLPKQNQIKQHYAAMPYQNVPTFLAEVRDVAGIGARGLELLVLTAVRSNEIRAAEWSEFDLAAKVWTIPTHRMKARREHRVPLSDRAVAILSELAKTRRSHFLLPGYDSSRHGSHELLRGVVQRLGRQCTVHGFRSSFRDWAAERTMVPREIAEMALAHMIGTATELAYLRSDLFEKRAELMQQWADFCGSTVGNVITLQRRAMVYAQSEPSRCYPKPNHL
jgi:integrase